MQPMQKQPSASPWLHEAIARIEADYQRSADTHLIPLRLPAFAVHGIDLYLKDESTHPTGSLKHRLARSLFLYALCNGWVHEGSTIVESSSGSTAVSEAYFARLLGLPFVAVMPRTTSPEKIAQIEFHGGRCHFVDSAGAVYDAARTIAAETGGYYMDQFTYAERATDWRGNNNIAESMFTQMAREPHPVPRWIVVGAGHGRHQRHHWPLCALPAPRHAGVCGRPGGFGVQRVSPHGRHHADSAGLAHRGHWPPACGAQLYPYAGGPHGGCA